jgi:hypothetical protein
MSPRRVLKRLLAEATQRNDQSAVVPDMNDDSLYSSCSSDGRIADAVGAGFEMAGQLLLEGLILRDREYEIVPTMAFAQAEKLFEARPRGEIGGRSLRAVDIEDLQIAGRLA